MANALAGIDHIVIAVPSLDPAIALFEKMGFVTTERGHHSEWGTANSCLMMGEGYIELLAAESNGPGAKRVLAHLEKKGPGVVAIAIASRDAVKSQVLLSKAGVAVGPVRALSREKATPAGPVTLRFSTVTLPEDALPGFPALLCQHHSTPHLRLAAELAHPNGARSLSSVTAIVASPDGLTTAYDRVFGPLSATPTDDMVTVHAGRSLLFLVTPDGFDHLHPQIDMKQPAPPAVAAITIAVADLDATAALLKARGVPFRRQGPHVVPAVAEELGVGIEFVPAETA